MSEMHAEHSEVYDSITNERENLTNTSLTLSSFEKSDSSSKTCNNCNNIIEEHAVKALGSIYHQDCFKCYDCGNVCKPKYFPFTINDASTNNVDKQVPLCQNDYFKRNNLICDVCKNLLKGTYYNAFGRLYDEEHFSCKICKETCSLQECFNFEGNLYCKFHYLKSYSKKCKGCEYPITDQHFEFERSGKIYRWHPECYGIHRYWHIDLRPSVLALPEFSQTPNNNEDFKISEKEKNELSRFISISQEYNYKTWSILYKFEEESASCISDMLQFLTHEDKTKGIDAAALLVLKVNCLFKAIDSIQSVTGSFSQSRNSEKEVEADNNENHDENIDNDNEANEDAESTQQSTQESIRTKYKKYPKSFSSRVMMYLQLLRKYDINEINKDKNAGNSDDDSSILSNAMSIINGLSHYLKLLIKFGVCNVLEYNKSAHSVNALEKFLREVNKSSQYKINPFSLIKNVSIDSTDSCEGCGKYIQQECIVFKNRRWHVNCLKCHKCKNLIERYDILDANYNPRTQSVLCPLCSTCDPNAESGFIPVSRLNNLTYLLKIALVKTRALVIIQMRGQSITNEVRTSSMLKEQSYMKTLNDIKNFRSKRNSMKIIKTSEKNLDDNIKSVNATSSKEHNHSQETIHQFNNSKTLTLDDISRIVAMEQSRVGKVEPVVAKRPSTPTSKSVSVLDTKKSEATSSVPLLPSRLKKMNSAFEVSSNKSSSKERSPDLNVKITNSSSGFKHHNKYEKKDKEESYEIYYSDLSSDHLYKIQLISLALLLSNVEKKNTGDVDSILKLLKNNANPILVSPTLSNKFWSKLKSHSKKHYGNEPNPINNENYPGNVNGSSPTPEQRAFSPDLGNNKDFDLSKTAKGINEQPTQVFGVSLNKLTEAHGVDSDLSLGSNRIRIPLVLDELIASLKQLDLSMEGLFRINGNIRKLREFTEEINANPGNVPDFSGENAIQLAALLKKFFRELPEPLLTTTLYNLWAGSMHDLDRIKLVYALLPKYHRNCCEVLFSFLKYVSTFSSGSKMDIHNLGTVFAPNILYSSEENTHADSGIAIQVVEDLIKSNEQMVCVPDNLMDLLKKTLDAKLPTDFSTINDYLKSKNII